MLSVSALFQKRFWLCDIWRVKVQRSIPSGSLCCIWHLHRVFLIQHICCVRLKNWLHAWFIHYSSSIAENSHRPIARTYRYYSLLRMSHQDGCKLAKRHEFHSSFNSHSIVISCKMYFYHQVHQKQKENIASLCSIKIKHCHVSQTPSSSEAWKMMPACIGRPDAIATITKLFNSKQN